MDAIKVTKKGLEAYLKVRLKYRREWALRALYVLYNSQSEHEKFTGHALKKDGVGFNKVDATTLNNIGEFYTRYNYISPKQLEIVHRMIPKYWKQILGLCDKPKLDQLYRRYVIEREREIEGV